jgi:hypothetical protein
MQNVFKAVMRNNSEVVQEFSVKEAFYNQTYYAYCVLIVLFLLTLHFLKIKTHHTIVAFAEIGRTLNTAVTIIARIIWRS